MDGLGVGTGTGLDVRGDVLRILPAGPRTADLDVEVDLEDVPTTVLHLDRVERRAAAVDTLLAERPELVEAAPVAWFDALVTLLDGDDPASARDGAMAAALIFERSGDLLPAATAHAVAALAAARAGDVGQALDHAVQALVAFGSLSDGDRDPDGEAGMSEMLGRLCEQFFDHDRALQFYELAVRALRDAPHDPARERAVQARIADLLLRRRGRPRGRAPAASGRGDRRRAARGGASRDGRRADGAAPGRAGALRRGARRGGRRAAGGPRRRGGERRRAAPDPGPLPARAAVATRRRSRTSTPPRRCSPQPATWPGRSPRSSCGRSSRRSAATSRPRYGTPACSPSWCGSGTAAR